MTACHHLFLRDEGDCLRCFTPRPSFEDAPLHPHPVTVPCGRCAEQVPLQPIAQRDLDARQTAPSAQQGTDTGGQS